MPTRGDPNHPSGHAHEVMTLHNGRDTEQHHGKRCTVIKAAEKGDPGYDVRVGKTVVRLETGETITLENHEVAG
jgi:hypothetical protein